QEAVGCLNRFEQLEPRRTILNEAKRLNVLNDLSIRHRWRGLQGDRRMSRIKSAAEKKWDHFRRREREGSSYKIRGRLRTCRPDRNSRQPWASGRRPLLLR